MSTVEIPGRRAIQTAPTGRRPLVQARRLTPQRKSSRRLLLLVIALSVLCGVLAGTLVAPGTQQTDFQGPTRTSGSLSAEPASPPIHVVSGAPSVTDALVSNIPIVAEATAVLPAAPTPDPKIVAQERLREAVFGPFRGVNGRFGIAVKDLGTGRSVLLNETFPFQAASLYKLPVMHQVFKLRENGALSFGEEMTIGPEDAAFDLGTLPWPIGTRITLGTALERMVTISDNSSAFMLTRRVGSSRINEEALSLGMNQTHILGDDLSTSAVDMLRLLEMIAAGRAVDSRASAEMVHLMARQQVRNRIPVLLPSEATVANKTGNWETAAHDVAIVYGPRATIVLALLSDSVTDFDALYNAMSTVARNVYDLANSPEFDSRAEPALPPIVAGPYAQAPKLPSTTTVAARATIAPASVSAPARAPDTPVPAQATAISKESSGPITPTAVVPVGITPAAGEPSQSDRRRARQPTPELRAGATPAVAPANPDAPKPTGPPLFNPAPVGPPPFQPTPAAKP